MFDCTQTSIVEEQNVADRIALYKKRREDAVALWKTIPANQFNIIGWDRCAIGWLGRLNHDGWYKEDKNIAPNRQAPKRQGSPFGHEKTIVLYFGLKNWTDIFCDIGYPTNFQRTLNDVSKKLLAAPYVFHKERV